MEFERTFWDASLDDLKKGYIYLKEDEYYLCLCCGEIYEEGVIYNHLNKLLDAKKAIMYHIEEKHGSMFNYLLEMDKKYTGLTENQKSIIKMFYEGLNDKDIALELGGSSSTIRNHRFTLREKAKQAKIYLALMSLLEEKKYSNNEDNFIPIHKTATNVDERYAITESEKETFLKKYFDGNKLISFPNKQKRIIVVLQFIASRFEKNKIYSESEVNEILKEIYSDYVTIRRYLIEYGFLDRTRDCKEYWVK